MIETLRKIEIELVTDDIAFLTDACEGAACLDLQTRQALNVEIGDAIEIEGSKTTVAIVRDASMYDAGRNIISLDWMTLENAGVRFGKKVKVRKAEPKNAQKVIISVLASEIIKYVLKEKTLNEIQKKLIGRYMIKGDRILVSVSSEDFFIEYRNKPILSITNTHPEGIVYINDSTEIFINDKTILDH